MKPQMLVWISILVLSCASNKKTWVVEGEDIPVEESLLDTLVVTDEEWQDDTVPKVFRPSATLYYDILHTKLALSFDWQKRHVLGRADLTITPYFSPIDHIVLDAVGFEIHGVYLGQAYVQTGYQYDDKKLTVALGKMYKRGENIVLRIDYTAMPDKLPAGGSDAITSEKGLFFIDPLDEDPDVPSQIWTQGETENNSRWFPTFDKPNERFTQEILLTVDTMYKTLSNGNKIASQLHGNGMRTDHWKQDKPHAPYLAMVAVGEFHEEVDKWENVPLHYFVEKKYQRHANQIFNHTPEMLSFFSEKLAFPYPWDKYAQVAVRDFVSGAMENTGAVVFGSFVQKTDKELIDNENDNIVAHEMMHHWFGDLVTCEDWSNLTLNEGFANYAEYLWLEHKYGKDKAEEHRINEMAGYFNQTYLEKPHPLIHYFYADKEKMFDAHSYNKGGLVLHMLRNYIGDDAFFASLNRYLTDNQFTAVEVDELRMAFEDVTGQDLHWFFDQWFLSPGHPSLTVSYTYDSLANTLQISVAQTQSPDGHLSVYRLPVEVAVYAADGAVNYYPALIDQRNQVITIEGIANQPSVAVLDGKGVLLASIQEEKSAEQYQAQYLFSGHFYDKYDALYNLQPMPANVIEAGLNDSYAYFRSETVRSIPDSLASTYADRLQALALSDPHSQVRREALIKLSMVDDIDLVPICNMVMMSESAYPVIDVALQVLAMADPEKAARYIARFRDEDSDYLAATLVGILGEVPTDEDWAFLERKARTVGVNHMVDFYTACQTYLVGKPAETMSRAIDFLSSIAADPKGNVYRKYLALIGLLNMGEDVSARMDTQPILDDEMLLQRLAETIRSIVENEQNPILKEKYSEMR
jgi:aminopeptidase N